jgi:hypothetical protein
LPPPPVPNATGAPPWLRSPWPAPHRTPPPSLAHVPSSPSHLDARGMMLPPVPARSGRNTAAHCHAMANGQVLTRPSCSTPSQSVCVASEGPLGFLEAGAPLCRLSSGRSTPTYRHTFTVVRPHRRQGCSGAVALGKSTCLGAVLCGEHGGVLGLARGAAGGVNPLAGVLGSPLPCPSLTDSGPLLADARARAGIGSGRALAGPRWRIGPAQYCS